MHSEQNPNDTSVLMGTPSDDVYQWELDYREAAVQMFKENPATGTNPPPTPPMYMIPLPHANRGKATSFLDEE
jgi:hypothetical protein